MARHNPTIAAGFMNDMSGWSDLDEQELVERLNPTIVNVEMDDSYNTKQKLKIYALISSLSNCSVRERKKYIKKIERCLR